MTTPSASRRPISEIPHLVSIFGQQAPTHKKNNNKQEAGIISPLV
jgi:hypothetical protein